MDLIKSCYVTKMKFWQGDNTEVKVRWYRARPGAGVFAGPTVFRAWSKWNYLTDTGYGPTPDLGEQLHAEDTEYYRGLNSGGYTGQHWDGPEDAWAFGGKHGVSPEIVTDDKGGSPGCPWNGAPGPVVIATSIHGAGQVVAIGGPSILRVQDSESWNDDFLHALARWLKLKGEVAPVASAGQSADWQQIFARPVVSDIGSADISYPTEAERVALRDKLRRVSALWVGWTNLDYEDDHQFLNPDIVYLVWEWIIDGGILILVNNTEVWDTEDPSPLNVLLEGINTPMKFVHGDYGPPVAIYYPVSNTSAASFHQLPGDIPWTSPGNMTKVYPSRSIANLPGPTGISEVLQVLGTWTGPDPIGLFGIRLTIWVASTVPSSGQRIDITVSNLTHGWTSTLTGPFTTALKKYVLGGKYFVPGFTDLSNKPMDVFIRASTTSGTCSISLSGLFVEQWECPSNDCFQASLTTNKLHDLVKPGGRAAICSVRWEQCSTIEGGDWVAAWAPNRKQEICPSGVAVGGVAGQGGPYIQIAEGGISVGGVAGQGGQVQLAVGGVAVGGVALQFVPIVQRASGGVAVGGVALQFVPIVQRASGGVAVGGVALQFQGFIQEGIGGLAVGGVAGQLLEPTQVGSGGVMVGGSAEQMIGPSQVGSGGVAVGGVATQG